MYTLYRCFAPIPSCTRLRCSGKTFGCVCSVGPQPNVQGCGPTRNKFVCSKTVDCELNIGVENNLHVKHDQALVKLGILDPKKLWKQARFLSDFDICFLFCFPFFWTSSQEYVKKRYADYMSLWFFFLALRPLPSEDVSDWIWNQDGPGSTWVDEGQSLYACGGQSI